MYGINAWASYLKPLLIPEEKKNDDHRCTDEMVIKIILENANLDEQICKLIHRSLLPCRSRCRCNAHVTISIQFHR
jgi:hypothetical protein